MKRSFLLLVITILSNNSYAQFHSIKINLYDTETRNVIENASVTLSDKYFAISNENGEAFFKEIPFDEFTLKTSHIGYKEFIKQIIIDSDTLLKIQLSPLSIKLNEIIITSTKYEKNIKDIPYAVSIIDKAVIAKNPPISISDILKNESGISLLRDGVWGTEVSIRGLNRANIITLIDGNRIETSTDISARLSMFDLHDIEKIEVIKGAASSLYGTGATGGIINIISKTGSYKNHFSISGNYNAGLNSVNKLFTNGLNLYASDEKWFVKFGGSYRKADNIITPAGELSNSQFEDNSINSTFQFKPFDDHELKISYQKFKALNVGIPGAAPLFPENAIVTYPQEERQLFSIEYKINNITEELIKFSAKYFHQFISRDVKNIPGIVQFLPASNGQPSKRINILKISPGADHKVDGFQAKTDFSLSNHYIISGLDFWKRSYNGLRSREQKIEILDPSDSSVVSTTFKKIVEKPLPNANYYSGGIYAHDEMKLIDNLSLTVGGRYDLIWLNNDETLNPLYEVNDGIKTDNPAGQKVIWENESVRNKSYTFNVGVVYSIDNYSSISFSAANSFRSPSLEERYQYIDLGSVLRVGNPDLRPEKGYFLEAGYKLFQPNVNFTANIFCNFLKDLVSEVPGVYENRNALIKTNIGEAQLYGFELSADFTVLKNLQFYNNLSFVRGVNQKEDSNLPQIPPLKGVLGVRYHLFDWIETDLSAVAFLKQDKIVSSEIETP